MGKRCLNAPLFPEELSDMISPALDIQPGIVLTDILGKTWKLGKTVGTGGFGEIYLASDSIYEDVDSNSQYVAKVERHTSGPLFVEIHCYLNIAKSDELQKWIDNKKLAHLGMPHYVASGSHTVNGVKYRFLILPRFAKDLHHIFESKNCKFNLKTVLTIARQVIDVLEYIHCKGYVHSDIKASNILLGPNREIDTFYNKSGYGKYRSNTLMRACKLKKMMLTKSLKNSPSVATKNFVKPTKLCSIDKLYLIDYGLVTKYVTRNGEHKQFCSDNRKAHAGTLLFCSRDAHEGSQSRRSDLECLGYNLIYWLTSSLPWSNDLEDPDLVYEKKQRCTNNLQQFLELCFDYQCPSFLYKYFRYLEKLKFDAQPDYNYCKSLFKNALSEYAFNDNLLVDFDNLEGQQGFKKINTVETLKVKRKLALQKLKRSPLKSNLPVRPRLRKQLKKRSKCKMNWSKIWMDPELLIKNAAKEKRPVDLGENYNSGLLNLDMRELNPTEAMMDVYNKFMDRQNNSYVASPSDRDNNNMDYVKGYTAAMMKVYNKKKQENLSVFQKKKKSSAKSNVKLKNKKANEVCIPTKVKTLKKVTTKQLKAKQLKRVYSLRG